MTEKYSRETSINPDIPLGEESMSVNGTLNFQRSGSHLTESMKLHPAQHLARDLTRDRAYSPAGFHVVVPEMKRK